MLSERGGSWPRESKHPYGTQELRGGNRGPSTRGKGGRSLRVTHRLLPYLPHDLAQHAQQNLSVGSL